MRGYERTRDENRHLVETRRSQVYETVPGYRELEEAVSTLSVTAARALLADDDTALASLHSQLSDLRKRRLALLKAAGFPGDYLEPVYTCPDCKDTGYVSSAEGIRTKCHCFRRQELSLLYAQSNIQEMIERENFSSLSYEYYQGEDLKRFRSAVDICQKFIKNFKQDYHNLFFYGTVGTGKSFLSGCIAKELLQSGCSVIYFSSAVLFDTLAHYSFDIKAKDSLQSFYDDLYNCELLIIDDLGTEVTNSFVTSQLFSCLNERALRRKSTIISTNLSLEEIRDRYSDRIFSRISTGFDLCKLTGTDIRIQKRRRARL
jgi:DNA replication protein DnaC